MPPARTCPRCCRELPVVYFCTRHAGSASLQSWCKPCHRDYHRVLRATKRVRRLRRGLREVRRAQSAGRIQTVVADLSRSFGGSAGLVRQFTDQINSAIACSDHDAALRGFDTICQLICAAEQLRNSERAAAAARRQHHTNLMTQEEIEERGRAIAAQWVAEAQAAADAANP